MGLSMDLTTGWNFDKKDDRDLAGKIYQGIYAHACHWVANVYNVLTTTCHEQRERNREERRIRSKAWKGRAAHGFRSKNVPNTTERRTVFHTRAPRDSDIVEVADCKETVDGGWGASSGGRSTRVRVNQ